MGAASTDLALLDGSIGLRRPTLSTFALVCSAAALAMRAWSSLSTLRLFSALQTAAEGRPDTTWAGTFADHPWAAGWLVVVGLAMLAAAAGLLLERGWGRALLVLALAAVALGAGPLSPLGFRAAGRLGAWPTAGLASGMLAYAALHRFWFEPGADWGSLARIPRVLLGHAALTLEQGRRLVGLPYLPWSAGPVLAAHGGRAPAGAMAEEFRGVDHADGVWVRAASVDVGPGPVTIGDPELVMDDSELVDELGVRVELPPGRYHAEVQLIRPAGVRRLRPARVRLLADGRDYGQASPQGEVGVDSGAVAVAVRVPASPGAPERPLGGPLVGRDREPVGLWTPTLSGDGMYEVSTLLDDGEVVGLVVDVRPGENAVLMFRSPGWLRRE